MAEQVYIDDFLKQVHELTKGVQVVGFQKKPFYGEIGVKFQDGKWYVFDLRHTEKMEGH